MTAFTVSIVGFAFLIGSINAVSVPRIIGGADADIKQFPFLVSFRKNGRHFCGGAIISDRHILTAAHCVESLDHDYLDEITVHSGASKSNEEGTAYKVQTFEIHSEYDAYDIRIFNDIAIVTLEKPITFGKLTQKIKLPSHDVQSHQVAYAAGWGKMSRWDSNTERQLQKLRVVLLQSDKCKPFVTRELRPTQVCAFRTIGKGACHGDSGGPIVTDGEVVGVTSYVEEGRCAEEIPTIYTNVFAHKDFIESVVNKSL